jgi:hypothetical protein
MNNNDNILNKNSGSKRLYDLEERTFRFAKR